VGGNVVNGAACGEPYACLQPILSYEASVGVFNALAHLCQVYAGLDEAHGVIPHLSVHLRSVPTLPYKLRLQHQVTTHRSLIGYLYLFICSLISSQYIFLIYIYIQ
jgi:hypothetical protein